MTHSIKFFFEYLAIRLLAGLLRRLSRPTALRVGGHLGLLAVWLLPKRRRLAEENLRRAFPELSDQRIAWLALRNFRHVGVSGAEILRIDMFRPGSDDLQRYYEVEGIEHLQQAQDLGRGVIMLSGHFGFWEMGNFPLHELGFQVDPVAKPMKNPLVGRYIKQLRETYGAIEIDSRKGARRVLNALQQGRIPAILLDQHISPPGSIPTRFFGRLGYTTTAITNLAMKYRIPVVPVFCRRLPDERYKLRAEPMLLLEGEGEQAVNENTQLLTEIIERAVRRDITQWFWMHKRWRVPENQAEKSQLKKDETSE